MAFGKRKFQWNYMDWDDVFAEPNENGYGLTTYVDESLRRIRMESRQGMDEQHKLHLTPEEF